ncbi:BT_3928 family protein [uncultured Muribaculum sp.]|uniref:BT_3928 family protein n=1 Tax=uncultured Muribaculum sp. TaxID=1918613 RepID=UPI0025E86CD2|nr:BT_3928 family protein [uncultured Muribaculum sp.]
MTNKTFPVWLCRVVVGVTFVISGLAKTIDLWGFIYKIEQYLAVWQIPVPHGVVFTVATTLAASEFLLGFLLLTGSYKRTCSWLIGLMMAGMLPLTLYIAIANPVADCGCFGDMWVISNTATFIKNVVLTILIIYLIVNNSKVSGLFTTYSQWLVAVIAIIYILVIAIFGYNIQPLVDFRSYPTGTPLGLYAQGGMSDDDPTYVFVYEKDGVAREFSEDSIPDDSWTFVDRIEATPGAEPDQNRYDGMITVYDTDGNEATAEAIGSTGEEVLLLIPDMANTDISSTYLINEINRHVNSRGGRMAAIIASDNEGIDMWRDLSMASYPIFTSEDTSIKEIARGNIAVVYLRDGVIQWKRTLNSIDSEIFDKPEPDTLPSLGFSGKTIMWTLSLFFLGLELFLWILDRSGRAVKLHFSRMNQKK